MAIRPVDPARLKSIAPPPRTRPAVDAVPPAPAYEVGYCKPPTGSRWKKGMSGNPAGRPRGSKNFDTLVKKVLEPGTMMRMAGGERRVPRIEALLWKLYEKGAKGDLRAIEKLIAHYINAVARARKTDGHGPDTHDPQPFSAGDEAALEAFRNMILGDLGPARDAGEADHDATNRATEDKE